MKPLRLISAAAIAGLMISGHAFARNNTYLQLYTLEGEAQNAGEKQFEVLSFSWGETNDGSAPASPGTLNITLKRGVTRDSLLKQYYDNKTEIPSMVLKSGDRNGNAASTPYMEFKLYKVKVTSYQLGASGDQPTEEVAFYYNEIE